MFDIIKSYLKDQKYYIIMMPQAIYIRNYQKLINIADNEVLLEINNNLYKLEGHNFSLIRSLDHELEIKGEIEGIKRI